MGNDEKSMGCEKRLLRLYIATFGCQMNVRDSELVAGLFVDKGYKLVFSKDDADIILFNTCSVREHAEDRVWGNIGMLRRLKRSRPHIIIGVIGCMAQRFGNDFFKRSDLVDLVCGPCDEEKLPQLAEKVLKGREKMLSIGNIGKPRKEAFSEYRCRKDSAYVNISHGCNNFCSYCIVPYVRGREVSRKPENIIREIKMLADKGIKEITLLGQNVNSYGIETRNQSTETRKNGFVDLLKKINSIDGIERIRFMTSHPKDASEDLFKAMAGLSKIVKHLHLPLQSGSDKILKLMNRGYTAEKYLALVERLRKTVPHCRLTTDIIVGFPGETKADFEKTYDLMKKIKFDAAYIFKYSPRPPAASSKMKDNVPLEEKERRNQLLLQLQRGIKNEKK
jgi:tRNA-2-methylthio-N6-dimethylallyladenosine synthase